MKRFWNWLKNEETGQRDLWLEGPIAEESWFGDEVTPELFKEELQASKGPVHLHINSPGGDCVAASMIYTMLMDYPGDVTVQIDGMAASAASVIAMAGSRVTMSPTAIMMVHNPLTVAFGDAAEMQKAISLLSEVKESIINAYQIKTGLPRERLGQLMDDETWMNAWKAKELGFCDEVLYADTSPIWPEQQSEPSFAFAGKTAVACLVNRVMASVPKQPEEPPVDEKRVNAADAESRLLRSKYL